MFKFFRKNIKVFIWLIVLTFIIWGAGSSIATFRGDSSSYAGKVGKENISQKEYLMVFRFYELLAQAKPSATTAQRVGLPSEIETQAPGPAKASGESATNQDPKKEPLKTEAETPKPAENKEPPKPAAYDEVKAIAWQTIILSREAKKRGIRVTDEEVAGEIQKQFSGAGSYFSGEIYENWVRRNFRGEPREFEEAFRKHLTIQKVREQILAGVPEADRQKHWIDFLIPVMSNAKFVDYTEKSSS